MNLNQTFCASYCVNYECKKMLSYSKVRAAEARDGEAAKRIAKNFARLENPDGIINDNKTTVKEV